MSKRVKGRLNKSRAMKRQLFQQINGLFGKLIREELINAVRQIEAHANLLAAVNSQTPLPSMRRWSISPDFGSLLAQVLDSNEYGLVLEFGSGTSTFILAALEGKADAFPSLQSHVALEHLDFCYQNTLRLLGRLPNVQRSQVWHCPLVLVRTMRFIVDSPLEFTHYDCQDRLSQHILNLPKPVSKVLALVDGPPGSTGRWARYPAVPLIMQLLPDADIHVLLDDYARSDEKETGQAWVKLLERNDYRVQVETPLTEKGALFIKATKLSSNKA